MPKQTDQYKFAKRITAAGVTVEIYDDDPYMPDSPQIVRASCKIGDWEGGIERVISLGDETTIGQILDLALIQLAEMFPPENEG